MTGLADPALNALLDLLVPPGTTGSDAAPRTGFVRLAHTPSFNDAQRRDLLHETVARRFRTAPAVEDALAADPSTALTTLDVSVYGRGDCR